MAGDEVTVIQMCGKCQDEISTFSVKKDNLMLTSTDQIWCPKCEESTPEVRDIAGRVESIRNEVDSIPKAVAAQRRHESSENLEA